MLRRPQEPPATHQDIRALSIFLMEMDVKLSEIHSFVLEDDDEEEDSEGS
jgi:hypothetical protein